MSDNGLPGRHHDPLPERSEITSNQAQVNTITDLITLNPTADIVDKLLSPTRWQQDEMNSTTIAKSEFSIQGLTESSSRASDCLCPPEQASQQENTWDIAANPMPEQCQGERGTYVVSPQVFEAGMYRNETRESLMPGDSRYNYSQRKMDIHCPLEESPSRGSLGIDSVSTPNTAKQNRSSGLPRDELSDTEYVWMSDCSETVPILEDRHPFLHIKSGVVRDALARFDHWRLRWADRHMRQVPVQKSYNQQRASRSHDDSSLCERENRVKSGKKRACHSSDGTTTKGDNDNAIDRKDAARWPSGHASQRGLGRRAVLSPRWPSHMPRKMR